MTETSEVSPVPRLRSLTTEDVMASLKAGFSDFMRAPAFGLFFGSVFSFIGIVIWLQFLVWESSYWVLPIAIGFPLVGPFLAVGLYEVSRELDRGVPLDWPKVIRLPIAEGRRQIPWMAFVALFFYLVWVYMAHLIFALSFGLNPLTNVMSSHELFLTQEGITMLIAGSIVGGGLAFLLFAISVISIPMMLDREVDVVTAMVLSFRSVVENKRPMLMWGIIVAVMSLIGMLPVFLGMLIVFPILGHASWHLYTRAVEPA
jgi:uncharacterized membrane protein